MTILPPSPLPPEPPVRDMSVSDLRALVEAGNVYRAKAVFELAGRAGGDDDAVATLSTLSRSPVLRNDRLHGYVSLAWVAVIGLLAGETTRSRTTAYAAFEDLGSSDQHLLLSTSTPNASRTPTPRSKRCPAPISTAVAFMPRATFASPKS
jgi:hypothetical protein